MQNDCGRPMHSAHLQPVGVGGQHLAHGAARGLDRLEAAADQRPQGLVKVERRGLRVLRVCVCGGVRRWRQLPCALAKAQMGWLAAASQLAQGHAV